MKFDNKNIAKSFAPTIIQKSIQAFDKSMATVVISCWSGALLLLVIALYTVNLSVVAKREATSAAAGEPSLPRVTSKPLTADQVQPLVTRLQRQFPEITFTIASQQMLTVTANEGSKFRLWLTVLSYIDTVAPQYRWTMTEFCVGLKCGGSAVMRALLKAESTNFAAPLAKE